MSSSLLIVLFATSVHANCFTDGGDITCMTGGIHPAALFGILAFFLICSFISLAFYLAKKRRRLQNANPPYIHNAQAQYAPPVGPHSHMYPAHEPAPPYDSALKQPEPAAKPPMYYSSA
ncbi:hypothetical protein BD779DRAFT_1669358 [Infundibulicybe gibba]|nr:hypothetical protein BD779DRAFT_1669358 [Infundibulicybe gibba]